MGLKVPLSTSQSEQRRMSLRVPTSTTPNRKRKRPLIEGRYSNVMVVVNNPVLGEDSEDFEDDTETTESDDSEAEEDEDQHATLMTCIPV